MIIEVMEGKDPLNMRYANITLESNYNSPPLNTVNFCIEYSQPRVNVSVVKSLVPILKSFLFNAKYGK